MPNGKIGDHPFTDILHHGSSEFGEPIDSLVKEMSKMDGFKNVREEVANILWENSPIGQKEPEKLKEKALKLIQNIYKKNQG